MATRSPRIAKGVSHRFDSLTELREFCGLRFENAIIRTYEVEDELVLVIQGGEGMDFESLVVHFEGEQTYAVMLPASDADPPGML